MLCLFKGHAAHAYIHFTSLQVGDVVSLKKKQLVEKLAALDVLICDEVTYGLESYVVLVAVLQTKRHAVQCGAN